MQNYNQNSIILEEEKFQEQKLKTFPIFQKYKSFNTNKYESMKECASTLQFGIYNNLQTNEQRKKLELMYTCKDRFCPFCAWRRARKIGIQSYNVLKAIEKDEDVRYIFATFTVKNCKLENLSDTIKMMNESFAKMIQTKRFKSSVLGFQRALEIPPQKNDFDYVHPHYHTLLCVSKSYFNKNENNYIDQLEWKKMWKKALNIDYLPSVDVRVIKSNGSKDAIAKAVAETVKYPLKSNDLKEMSIEQFEILTKQMKAKRSLAFGGIIKEYRKKLVLDDAEKGDLIYDDFEDKKVWKKIKTLVYNFRNDSLGDCYYLDKETDYTSHDAEYEEEVEQGKEQAKEQRKKVVKQKLNKRVERKIIDVLIDDVEYKLTNEQLTRVKIMPYQMNNIDIFEYYQSLDIKVIDINHYNYTKKLLYERTLL
jgi:plasmid rolling circle replication initiator protein Rep